MNFLLRSVLGIAKLETKRRSMFKSSPSIWKAVIEHFHIDVEVTGSDSIKKILQGQQQNFVIVANHPYGILDGFLIGHFLETYFSQTDFKFISNNILTQVLPELNGHMISVDNMSGAKATRAITNFPALIESMAHLRSGKSLVIFPAGEVSEFQFQSSEGQCKITDKEWQATPLALASKCKVSILPIYISGSQPFIFQMASFLGVHAKRLMAFRLFVKTPPAKIRIHVHEPLSASTVSIAEVRQVLYSGARHDR